jgi:hypothetical protein
MSVFIADFHSLSLCADFLEAPLQLQKRPQLSAAMNWICEEYCVVFIKKESAKYSNTKELD